MRAGDGVVCRVLVNGREVAAKDLGPQRDIWGNLTWSTAGNRFRVPLGAHAGLPVVITLALWGKGNANCDEVWISEPKLVNDSTQTSTTSVVTVVE